MTIKQLTVKRRHPLVVALSLLLILITAHTNVFVVADESDECAIFALFPFTNSERQGARASIQYDVTLAFGHMAAALMAIDHFNARNPVVVPQLAADEFIDCNVTIPIIPDWTIADDGYSKLPAVSALLAAAKVRKICAIVGPYNRYPATGAALLAGGLGVPIVSYHADSTQFGKSFVTPLSTKIIADESVKAEKLIDYIVNERKRNYIAFLHMFTSVNELKVMNAAAKIHSVDFVSESVRPPFDEGPSSIPNALQRIKDIGYRTIVVALTKTEQWDELYDFAEAAGLTNPGYFWMAYDSTDLSYLTKETDSLARAKLLNGAGTLRVLDGFQYDPQNRFLKSWRSLANNASFVQRLNELNPIQPTNGQGGGGGGGNEQSGGGGNNQVFGGGGGNNQTGGGFGGGGGNNQNGGGGNNQNGGGGNNQNGGGRGNNQFGGGGGNNQNGGGRGNNQFGGGGRGNNQNGGGNNQNGGGGRNLQGGRGGGRFSAPTNYFYARDDYFTMYNPSPYSGYVYDAIIALGMGKCRARAKEMLPAPTQPSSGTQNLQNVRGYPNTNTDNTHYNELVEVKFSGATGPVQLHDTKDYTRLNTTMAYGIYNLRVKGGIDVLNSNTTSFEFQNVLTAVMKPNTADWVPPVGGIEFIFSDGTANEPMPLRDVEVNSVPFPTWAIVVVLCVGIICVVTAYVYVARKKKHGDSVWSVKPTEIIFGEPPDIIGRGTFGLVLLAEYRGTEVAIKRVIPPRVTKEAASGNDSKEMTTKGESKWYWKWRKGDVSSVAANVVTALDSSILPDDEDNLDINNESDMGRVSGLTIDMSMDFGKTSGSKHSTEMGKTSGGKSSGKSGKSLTPGMLMYSGKDYRRLKHEFVQEMRQLAKLRHPCITTVMGAVISKHDEPMLVMEFMEHGSLYDLLHNDTLLIEGNLLLPVLRDIAQGIRFLHAATPIVIHGDLKSANVLIDCKFRAKVADFGLSQKKKVGGTGTPYWMAPELLRQECDNNAMTDVYSFGIILYEAYSRLDPYEGEDYMDVLRLVADPEVNKRPPVPTSCPPQVQSLMTDCVQGNSENRPTFEELDIRLKRLDAETVAPMGNLIVSKQAKKEAREAAGRTEDLLFEVFPQHIAEALRDGRKVDPESRDMVTIFFSDIVGFTNISSTLTPIKISDMLDRLYSKFDFLSRKYDVFKVETIGDAYMAVTNLVKDQPDDHVRRIAEFSIEALRGANDTLIDLDNESLGYVNIRVGFHSGPVVANVVGSRNPRYCLFGDTVNTSSRMESNSELNRIHCSQKAAILLRTQDPAMRIRSRGIITVKGKGEMRTYWVNEEPHADRKSSIVINAGVV